ncbi:MAG: hypothetical protein LKM39_17170 [Chiayiivirga sp.]|nr:hypothetical protein [Chiayiivirga sp.]
MRPLLGGCPRNGPSPGRTQDVADAFHHATRTFGHAFGQNVAQAFDPAGIGELRRGFTGRAGARASGEIGGRAQQRTTDARALHQLASDASAKRIEGSNRHTARQARCLRRLHRGRVREEALHRQRIGDIDASLAHRIVDRAGVLRAQTAGCIGADGQRTTGGTQREHGGLLPQGFEHDIAERTGRDGVGPVANGLGARHGLQRRRVAGVLRISALLALQVRDSYGAFREAHVVAHGVMRAKTGLPQ